jgi:hypothetical protein
MIAKRQANVLGLCAVAGLIFFSTSAIRAGEAKKDEKPPPPDAKADPGEKESASVRQRVIGTIVFPDRTGQIRKSSAKELLTPEVRSVTERALDYVRKMQQPDGSWGDKEFPKSSGVTALCCMALFAEGSLPRVGPSGRRLDKGIEFLLSCAKEDGLIVAKDTYKYGPMYDHTWATDVLLQAYGNAPWYPDMRQKISRAMQKIISTQKSDGGWRYAASPTQTSDISVTASVLATLRMAKMSGFAVPESAIKRGEEFVIRLGKPRRPEDEGTFCYREGGQRGGPSTTAAGLLALFSSGQYNHPYVAPCTDSISYIYSRYRLADLEKLRYFHFGCYYSSQAMFMAQDKFWQPWFKKFVSVLRATQLENGEFKDRNGNVVYPTAIAAVVLQSPYGYLPQYLR